VKYEKAVETLNLKASTAFALDHYRKVVDEYVKKLIN